MPDFPRTVKPLSVTWPVFPPGLDSWGQSGKGQFRSILQVGRQWKETYPPLSSKDEDARELLAIINQYWRERTIFDIDHVSMSLLGAGGGTPLVNGASQTGSNLVVDGGPISVTGWLKAGDVIKMAGLNLVYDVTADVNTDGSGNATIPISPPIFSGGSPANNAAVTITGVKFRAVISDAINMPESIPSNHYFGLTLNFREAP